MLNTPPTWNWYLAGLMFKWMLAQGGVEAFAKLSQAKSSAVYEAIDGSGGFYRNDVVPAVRSRMNIPFFLPDDTLNARFVSESKAAGLLALKGHKAVGGIRASLYNAMPLEGAQALAAFMRDFQQRNG
ncbi:Phosphoserine aminotransferase [compost metagenome]